MKDQTATEQILASDLAAPMKATLLRALLDSDCRDCAREAHKALHKLERAC